jgi:hypothetical protein
VNPLLGWCLVVAAVVMSARAYGWPGVAFAVTVIVFWLLLQFNRAMRAMRGASSAPVGHVGSAVMLNARLKRGMTMLQIIGLTRSLGRSISKEPEVWRWADDGGSVVTATLQGGRLADWRLERPEPPPADA